MQRPIGRPTGLGYRLVRSARDVPGALEPGAFALVGHVRHPQVGAVPRHPGVVPREPGQPAAVAAQAGGGVEVVATGQRDRLAPAPALACRAWPERRGRHGDEVVDHFAIVALAHAHEP